MTFHCRRLKQVMGPPRERMFRAFLRVSRRSRQLQFCQIAGQKNIRRENGHLKGYLRKNLPPNQNIAAMASGAGECLAMGGSKSRG